MPALVLLSVLALLAGCVSATMTPAAGPAASDPWAEARARGVTLRALGTEPFWALDLTDGGQIVLQRAYREDTVTVPTPPAAVAAGETHYRARTDAHTLALTVREATCSDGMSDTVYPLTVTVVTDGETLNGCGRWL